jgi:hypothetical protein
MDIFRVLKDLYAADRPPTNRLSRYHLQPSKPHNNYTKMLIYFA